MRNIIIGTRGSELALWQANHTKTLLEQKGYQVELKIISTQGDRTQQWNTSFEKLEGKGFFTKELEDFASISFNNTSAEYFSSAFN